ncbi:MAG: sulfur oxidation c-type cytochrome SoxA, partial [Pseudomonadota bacterium]
TESLEQSAASFPKIDPDTGALLNLEGRINLCRETHQNAPALPYESEDLLSLTAYIANLSNGAPVRVQRTPQTQSYFDAGADYFFTRRGQLNLSCHHCHDDNWGKQLRGDTISQGHGNGFPTYRLEWQTLGSLHRRFRDCDAGVRAEPKALGSETYLALEFYLAARGAGLSIESPSVRR